MNVPNWWWLATIPAVLAIGAMYWLFFVRDTHDFRRQLSQESRRAEYVGAMPLPKKKIAIEIRIARNCPIAVEKADLDGDKLWIYLHNKSQAKVQFVETTWRGLSPDGTVVVSNRRYIPSPEEMEADEKREVEMKVKPDPRIEKVVVSIGWYGD